MYWYVVILVAFGLGFIGFLWVCEKAPVANEDHDDVYLDNNRDVAICDLEDESAAKTNRVKTSLSSRDRADAFTLTPASSFQPNVNLPNEW